MSVPIYYSQADNLLTLKPCGAAVACRVEYLNEGGANIVYRILTEDNTELPTCLQRKLLRLRKNLGHVQPATEQLKAYNENFRGWFPEEHLVQHELIRLDDGVAVALNDALRQRVRPSHRLQDFLPTDEQYGLLVSDMTSQLGEILVEFKPKWLLQSPGAPKGSVRCRTCAMRAQRAAKDFRTATDKQGSCPLALISRDASIRKKAALSITDDRRIAEYLANDAQGLLAILRDYQAKLDPSGTLEVKTVKSIYDLCRAMTIRDCTLYIKRTRNLIEARLGDLDLKQPEKLAHWKKVERSLIDDGWYNNDESPPALSRETICLLSR